MVTLCYMIKDNFHCHLLFFCLFVKWLQWAPITLIFNKFHYLLRNHFKTQSVFQRPSEHPQRQISEISNYTAKQNNSWTSMQITFSLKKRRRILEESSSKCDWALKTGEDLWSLPGHSQDRWRHSSSPGQQACLPLLKGTGKLKRGEGSH